MKRIRAKLYGGDNFSNDEIISRLNRMGVAYQPNKTRNYYVRCYNRAIERLGNRLKIKDLLTRDNVELNSQFGSTRRRLGSRSPIGSNLRLSNNNLRNNNSVNDISDFMNDDMMDGLEENITNTSTRQITSNNSLNFNNSRNDIEIVIDLPLDHYRKSFNDRLPLFVENEKILEFSTLEIFKKYIIVTAAGLVCYFSFKFVYDWANGKELAEKIAQSLMSASHNAQNYIMESLKNILDVIIRTIWKILNDMIFEPIIVKIKNNLVLIIGLLFLMYLLYKVYNYYKVSKVVNRTYEDLKNKLQRTAINHPFWGISEYQIIEDYSIYCNNDYYYFKSYILPKLREKMQIDLNLEEYESEENGKLFQKWRWVENNL